jgi:Trypsin-co-occurring domain 1
MTGVVEVPLAGGGSILVEVDDPGGPVTRGRGGRDLATLPALEEPLERVLGGLLPTTRALLGQLRALADSPHEIELEFAVKVSADAKLVIARAGGEANFRIALKWSSEAGSGA